MRETIIDLSDPENPIETERDMPPADPKTSANANSKNIPGTGFGGPSIKELFNGNN